MSSQVCQNAMFWRNNLKKWSTTQPSKLHVLMEMSLHNNTKELQSFLGVMNYLGKFSPVTAEMCKPLRKLTSLKVSGHGTMSTKTYMKEPNLSYQKECTMAFYKGKEQI